MSLARKAFSGVVWTAAERFGLQFIQFVVLIVLARLLTPVDFGLVAMLTVVFSVSGVLVNGGFTAALIREVEITEEDKSTAFWLNVLGAVVLYGVIWLAAPAIAAFFEQPRLVDLTRFMALTLVFTALSLVQQAELTHRLDFKRLGLRSLAASGVTGVIAIGLAYLGAGVWALAVKQVLVAACNALFLYMIHPWFPKRWISGASIRKLFGFGWKLAASGLLNEVYQNIYKLVIGKFFAASTLGFYTQAQNFTNLASQSLVGMLQRVTYPILAKANTDRARLKRAYRSMIQVSSFMIFPAMIGIALAAEPLILTLVGEQWLPTVPFLQLLCVSGALYHLHSINLNVLKVVGRTDLFLRLEIIKRVNTTIALVVGLQFGIWGLMVAQVLSSYVALFINMYYTRTFIDYSIPEQLRDVAGVILLSIPMALAAWLTGRIESLPESMRLLVMVATGLATYAATLAVTRPAPLQAVISLLPARFTGLARVSG